MEGWKEGGRKRKGEKEGGRKKGQKKEIPDNHSFKNSSIPK